MIEVVASTDVSLPASELFAFVGDMSNNPPVATGPGRLHVDHLPPIGVGSTYDQHARFLGRDLVSSFEVVEFEPDRRIRIRTVGGGMPTDITREVEPLGPHRARVRATIRGGPGGPLRVFDPLTRRMVARSVRGDYERLAAILGPA